MRSNSTAACPAWPVSPIRHRELARDVGGEFALRIVGAEALQHLDGARPFLELDELRAGVVLGLRGDLRSARDLRDAQEVVDRAETVARLLLGFALAIHGRGDAFGEIRAHLVVRRQQVARGDVALLRFGELQQIEVRLADDGVRDAALGLIGRRLVRQHQVRDFDRALQILRREDVFGGARQHAGAVGMFGEAGAELHAGVDGQLVCLGLFRGRQRRFVLGERAERGIGGRRGARIARIVVRGLGELGGGALVVLALVQRLGQQVVGAEGIRIVREGLEVGAIPARRLAVFVHLLRLLRIGVEEGGDVLQVDLQFLGDVRIVGLVAAIPERGAVVVQRHVFALAFEHQLGEAALAIGLDGLL